MFRHTKHHVCVGLQSSMKAQTGKTAVQARTKLLCLIAVKNIPTHRFV